MAGAYILPRRVTVYRCDTQPTLTCSNLAIETLEQSVKYVQS